MDIPTTPSNPSPTLPARKPRRWIIILGSLLGLLIIAGLVWQYRFRGTGAARLLNPVYWYHRARGEDLYSAEDGMLLHGNHDLPEIAITFDDGPHIASRGSILETLRRYNVKATFFDVGSRMNENPSLLLQTLRDGHEEANHSTWHNRLDGLSPELRHREINDTDIAYCRITGRHLTLLRPPGMKYNRQVLADAKSLGYLVVSYTTAAQDYDVLIPSHTIAERSLKRVENGSILLLHDYPGTAEALPDILSGLQKRGFKFVTISEMIQHLPERPRKLALNRLAPEENDASETILSNHNLPSRKSEPR